MSKNNPTARRATSKNSCNEKLREPKPHAKDIQVQDIVKRSVVRSGLSYESFVKAIIQSALSRLTIWTQVDLERLLLMAERLKLDPLSNEIFAIESQNDPIKKSQVLFVVGVDGWSKIINAHPQFDGMRFIESEPGDDELPLYFECTIFRKDRKVATSVREYMYEAHTNQGAWLTHPRRMLRHKAMIQCARICFGLSGVYDPDEAQRIAVSKIQTSLNSHQTPNKSKEQSNVLGQANVKGLKIKQFENISTASSVPITRQDSQKLGSEFVKKWVKKFPIHPEPKSAPLLHGIDLDLAADLVQTQRSQPKGAGHK